MNGGLRHRPEGAFTLVEIVVATALILVISAGAIAVASSSSTSVTRNKAFDRQKSAASSVLRRAMADTGWIERNGCGVGVCTIPSTDPVVAASLADEPDGTIRHEIRFEAEGIDLAKDGVGASDGDGIVPDAYRLKVTNTVTGSVIGADPHSYVTSATLDRSGRGNRGTIEIRACTISPQVDERIGTGLCSSTATATYRLTAPANCVRGRFDCDAWLAAIADDPAYATVTLQPTASARFRLVGPLPATTVQSITTDSTGRAFIRDLAPGQYRLDPEAASVPDHELWSTHSTPAGGYVTIGGGSRRIAVQLFRPVRTAPVRITVTTVDKTDPARIVRRPGGVDGMGIKLLPIPGNRDIPERGGATLGWTNLVPGVGNPPLTAEVPGYVAPGLYAARLLTYPGDSSIPLTNHARPYVWIPPGSASPMPMALRLEQETCDAARRMAIVRATCPAGWRFCFVGGRFYGACDQPTPPNDDTGIGGGGA